MKVINKKSIKIFKVLLTMGLVMVVISCGNRTNDNKGMIETASGLQYKTLKEGNGTTVKKGQEIRIHETTKYTNDSLVFSSRSLPEPIKVLVGGNHVIKGFEEGVLGMRVGEVRKLIIPPSLSKRMGEITFPHPDSTLVYEIELMGIVQKTKVVKENKIMVDTITTSC